MKWCEKQVICKWDDDKNEKVNWVLNINWNKMEMFIIAKIFSCCDGKWNVGYAEKVSIFFFIILMTFILNIF